MNPKLSVLLQVDLEANHVNVAVTGQLTATNQRALYPLIDRARALVPGIRITLDLSAVRHIDTTGLDLLSRAIQGTNRPGGGRITLVLPEPPPVPSVRRPGTTSLTLAGSPSLTAPMARHGSTRRTAA
jgi:anti-anti-sigma factor